MSSSSPAPIELGKHPLSNSASVDTKRQKTEESDKNNDSQPAVAPSSSFRAWSKTADENNASTIFTITIKCIYGDPSKPLSSSIKAAKVTQIKEMLKARNLPTEGAKKVLLNRLQRKLPHVILDIDSRECLLRLINAVMFHFPFQVGQPTSLPMQASRTWNDYRRHGKFVVPIVWTRFWPRCKDGFWVL